MTKISKVDTGNGVLIQTEVSGLEDGPWIVLSNSLGATRNMWRPQLRMLEASFRVLRYDTRGHGDSSTPPGPYSLDDLVADAAAVIEAHGAEDPVFMGLSMGGMTALGLGLRRPGLISKAVCCAARADAPPPFVQNWIDRISVIQEKGIGGIWSGTLEKWLTAETIGKDPALVDLLSADFHRTTAEGYTGCAEALKKLDYLRLLSEFPVPALYVAGAEDLAAPAAAMRQMADATPGSAYVEIPQAAHITNCDNAPVFNRAVADFLGIPVPA